MKNKEFKVLLMDINKKTYEEYDILPYFRREWKIRPFGRDEKYKKIPVTTKPQLREWVDAFAKYQFWSRCQYEFLMAQWPFCTRKINDDIRHYVKVNPDANNEKDDIQLCNIIIKDMVKIDVYEQIRMNIDVIVDILYEEFLTK